MAMSMSHFKVVSQLNILCTSVTVEMRYQSMGITFPLLYNHFFFTEYLVSLKLLTF